MIEITPTDFLHEVCPQEVALGLPDRIPNNSLTGPFECQGSGDTWSCAHIDGIILACLAHKLGSPILEIGASCGASTRYLHDGLVGTNVTLIYGLHAIYSVDINHRWTRCDEDYPYRIRIDSDSCLYTPPQPCTWAFIDGDHRFGAVVRDIANARRAGCRHMLFHDTSPHCQSPADPGNPDPNYCEVRAAILTDLAVHPAYRLYDISTPQGMIFATRNDP